MVSNIFWPSSSSYEKFPLSSEDECSRSCFSDCNCVVVVIKLRNCWKKKLPLSDRRLEWDTYGRTLVKVPKSDDSLEFPRSPCLEEGKKDQTTVILVVSILLGGSVWINLIFVAAISVVMFCSYQKNQNDRVFWKQIFGHSHIKTSEMPQMVFGSNWEEELLALYTKGSNLHQAQEKK